ncbi:MAG TPA: hypothetical protein VFK80_10990, partial [Limnochordia bacterium]|nr:hypothetical protein [Limnochordia bacterium]
GPSRPQREVADMWNGWPAERWFYLLIGVIFAAIFIQVTLMHRRQNFRHPAMWFPVVATPTLAGLAFLLTAFDLPALRVLLALGAAAGTLIGLVGSYFHVAGAGERVGGFTLDNFMTGPPPMLPAMVTAMSLVTLLVLYLL